MGYKTHAFSVMYDVMNVMNFYTSPKQISGYAHAPDRRCNYDKYSPQGVYKSSLTNFKDTLNKVPAGFLH